METAIVGELKSSAKRCEVLQLKIAIIAENKTLHCFKGRDWHSGPKSGKLVSQYPHEYSMLGV
jgi:hypothetical protein